MRVSIRSDERRNVRVDLAHNKSVDVEELGHPVHGQVAGDTAVDKFKVSLQL